MLYLRWTETEDTEMWPGVVEEWTEVGPDGVTTRELAFDAGGGVVHVFPSDRFPDGKYGRWDLARIGMAGRTSDIDAAEFERRWRDAERNAVPPPRRPSMLELRLRRVLARMSGK